MITQTGQVRRGTREKQTAVRWATSLETSEAGPSVSAREERSVVGTIRVDEYNQRAYFR